MGGVVEAIGDAVGDVFDAVGDAVEWVGDTASNIVEHALDNPVETALMVGVAFATGGTGAAAFGLEAPLTALEASSAMAGISGASTLAHGGDLGDALTSAATTFAVSQGVSYAFDAFGASGAPDSTATTTQFSDTGTVTQNFADGSQLVTDASGAVTPVASSDWMEAGLQSSGAETFAIPDAGAIETSILPPVSTETVMSSAGVPETTIESLGDVGASAAPISPENVPLVESSAAVTPDVIAPPPATYDTMEQLLLDKGLITPDEALAAVAPPPMIPGPELDQYDLMPDSYGNAVAMDPNAPAIDTAAKQYETMEDLMYDKGLINDAQYKDLTGVAPVVDLSQPAQPMSDVSTLDALKDLGGAAVDYAIENPLTTAGIVAGGAALAGGLGGQPDQPGAPADTKKTYTYGPGAPINRTGLQELWSAASKIYGGDSGVMKQLGIQAPSAPQFQSSFRPVLEGAAPGAGKIGLGALGQGFSYTPMGRTQSFDISTLTPEQIVQLQEAVARKKPGEGA